MPIKHRLPLFTGSLLFGIIALSIWASYRGVKESALELGSERLRSLTQQLASQPQQSLPIALNRTLTAANEPAVRTFLSVPSDHARTAAVLVLQQFAPAQDSRNLQVELWNASGSLALIVPETSSPETADLSAEFKQSAADPFKTVGPIRVLKDLVVYTMVAAVKDDQGKPIGFLVRWRRVAATPNVRKQLSELLGSEAELFYGNDIGDVWTDLEKSVPKPPVALRSTLEVTHYSRGGNSVMAMGRPISGTPWFILVEFPEHAFLIQANRFLRRTLLIGIALLGVGVAITFFVSHSITQPLQLLTQAARSMSAGDFSAVVNIRRNDELGDLGKAFNAMVVKVRDSQHDLEQKIHEHQRAEEKLSAKSEELSQMTQQLWQSSKLATMGELSASIAHELNNPLATVGLRTEMLIDGFTSEDPRRKSAEVILHEVERMAGLVESLLEFSRRGHRQSSTVDVGEEISNSVNFISYFLRNHNIRIIHEFREDLPTIQADRQQLRQLFLNLLTNATDAMPNGGTLTTRTDLTDLAGARAVKIEFIDSGVGVPAENLERIWDSFFTTKPEGKGTGLGLAICRRIVEEHRGVITIASSMGVGTTVEIKLPATTDVKAEETQRANDSAATI